MAAGHAPAGKNKRDGDFQIGQLRRYLKSTRAAGTTEGAAVAAQMHALPVDDFFAKGRVREDGRLLHDFFLAEVKAPSESTAPWDYYKIRRIIPAQEAAQPLAQSKCALVRL